MPKLPFSSKRDLPLSFWPGTVWTVVCDCLSEELAALSGLLKCSPKHARKWTRCTLNRVLEPSHTISFLEQYPASDIGWVRKHNGGSISKIIFKNQEHCVRGTIIYKDPFDRFHSSMRARETFFSQWTSKFLLLEHWDYGTIVWSFSCLAGRKPCFPSIIGTFLRHDLVLFSITFPFPSSTTCFALMLIFFLKKKNIIILVFNKISYNFFSE